MPAPGTPQPGSRDYGLDALRGLAALAVLVFHVAGAVRYNAYGTGGVVTGRLKVGVPVFFTLSGYLLYRQLFAGRPRGGVRRYALRRIARIAPAYWLALLVVALVPVFAEASPRLDVLEAERTWVYFAFAQVFSPDTVRGGISPAWSLSSELAFYLLLPVLALGLVALRRRAARPLRRELAVLGGAALVLLAVSSLLGPQRSTHPNLIVTPVMTALWFLPGMAWAAVSQLRPDLWRSPRARVVAGVLGIGGFGGLCAALPFRDPRPYIPWAAALEYTGFALVAGCLLVALTGLGRGVLLRPLAALGTISFGVYLWHVPILVVLAHHGPASWRAEHTVLPLLAGTLGLSLLAGTLSWFLVERPVLRLAARPWGSHRAAAPPERRERSRRAEPVLAEH